MARATRQAWVERVAQWQSSGLTAQAFAESAELNAHSLSNWKYRLGREQRERAGKAGASKRRTRLARVPKPTFIEARSALSAGPIAGLELLLRDEVTVRVPVGFDEDTLVRLMRIVRTAP
jgi:hypothetical protein